MNAHPMNIAADEHRVPRAGATVLTLAGITLRRLTRGKALWIGHLIAALPVIFTVVLRSFSIQPDLRPLVTVATLVLVVLPAMFVGASIGEEIEERTSTYLWSRPIARWAVMAGKLCALTPIVIALSVGGWVIAFVMWFGHAPTLTSCLALAVGGLAASLIAAGLATVLPKHGMALTIGYMLIDGFIGALPASLRELSVLHQLEELSGLFGKPVIATPVIALTIVAGIWTAIGVVRIHRLEA
jgi:ABC-type transport system involved in multi-copper enzyme maturation permease subunit